MKRRKKQNWKHNLNWVLIGIFIIIGIVLTFRLL
jgi:predicted nucleic acid-binding Zn ribbon protein